jgi:hypothetical protein
MAPNGRSVNRTRRLGSLKDGATAGLGIAASGTRQVAHRKPRPGLACGVFGPVASEGCAEPGGVRSRRLRADVESMSMVSNSDDLAPSGSAHGYLGVRLA